MPCQVDEFQLRDNGEFSDNLVGFVRMRAFVMEEKDTNGILLL